MSTTLKATFCLFIAVCFSLSAEAQIFDKISRTINSALDDTVDKFSDKMAEAMVEKFFQKIFEGEQANTDSLEQYQPDTTSASNSSLDLSGLFGSSKKVDKTFTFDHKMIMNISNGDNVNELTYYLTSEGSYMGMEISNMFIITEYETGESYTIMNGSLTSFNVSKIIEKYSGEAVDDGANYTFEKTGRKEVIAGYESEEYIGTSESGKMNIWITENFVTQHIQNTQVIAKLREQNKDHPFPANGYAMRFISTDENNESTTMEVTSVSKETKIMDLSEY